MDDIEYTKKYYIKTFLHRGAIFAGFGPIICGIVFIILDNVLDGGVRFSGTDVFVAILSTYLLAFVQAGASIFNQIEHWPLAKSLLCHFSTLYVAYVLCYTLNSWIPFEPLVILIFTLVFLGVYLAIWCSVYFAIKISTRRMNMKMQY